MNWDAQYDAWASAHATAFGMSSEADLAMLAAWREAFRSADYSPGELHAATQAMILDAAPRFRNEHLAAIHDAIRRGRAGSRDGWLARNAPADDRGVCVNCGNSGWVSVPHPKTIRDGRWIAYGNADGRITCAVVCSCLDGRRVLEAARARPEKGNRAKRDPLTLERYAAEVPDWREIVAEDLRRQKAGRRAETITQEADRVHGPLQRVMDRIIARTQSEK